MKNKRVCIYENHKFESWIKRIEMKVTISVMKTTWAEVKMKPEKKKQHAVYRLGHFNLI